MVRVTARVGRQTEVKTSGLAVTFCPQERCLSHSRKSSDMAKAPSKDIPVPKSPAPDKPSKRKKAREKLVADLDKGPLF